MTFNLKNCTAAFARELPTEYLPVLAIVALLVSVVDDVDVLGVREGTTAQG